jgi:hypothetical protein
MASYSYPTDFELRDVETSKLTALNAADPLERFMPTVNTEDWLLRWTVEGYAGGLQQLRGLDVAPPNVARVGMSDYLAEPGVYGEQMSVREKEMTTRAARFFPGLPGGRIDITDLIMKLQDQLLDRRLSLTRYLRATLLTTATFAVADKAGSGGYRHTDTYTAQTYDATTWATAATATPIYDLRQVKLKGRGLKADFGRNATALMNQTTFNNLIGNTNAADLGGQKTTTLSPLIAADEFNRIMLTADLPQILIWEDGYYDTGGTFHLYTPNGVVAVLSAPRPEGPIGEYRMCFNAVTDKAGPYAFVNDSSKIPNKTTVPPTIEVHDGHNGGPVMLRPHQVVIVDVS